MCPVLSLPPSVLCFPQSVLCLHSSEHNCVFLRQYCVFLRKYCVYLCQYCVFLRQCWVYLRPYCVFHRSFKLSDRFERSANSFIGQFAIVALRSFPCAQKIKEKCAQLWQNYTISLAVSGVSGAANEPYREVMPTIFWCPIPVKILPTAPAHEHMAQSSSSLLPFLPAGFHLRAVLPY